MITTITSLRSGEGKSTIIKKKAEESKAKNVMVIDLDVYQPVLADRFNIKVDTGIIEYLEGKELNIVDINNIKFIPCIKSKKTIKDVIENKKFIELFNNLANEYDEIYIDAPPISVTTDVKKLFNMCDGTILVKGYKWDIFTEIKMKEFLKGVNIVEIINNEDIIKKNFR